MTIIAGDVSVSIRGLRCNRAASVPTRARDRRGQRTQSVGEFVASLGEYPWSSVGCQARAARVHQGIGGYEVCHRHSRRREERDPIYSVG